MTSNDAQNWQKTLLIDLVSPDRDQRHRTLFPKLILVQRWHTRYNTTAGAETKFYQQISRSHTSHRIYKQFIVFSNYTVIQIVSENDAVTNADVEFSFTQHESLGEINKEVLTYLLTKVIVRTTAD